MIRVLYKFIVMLLIVLFYLVYPSCLLFSEKQNMNQNKDTYNLCMHNIKKIQILLPDLSESVIFRLEIKSEHRRKDPVLNKPIFNESEIKSLLGKKHFDVVSKYILDDFLYSYREYPISYNKDNLTQDIIFNTKIEWHSNIKRYEILSLNACFYNYDTFRFSNFDDNSSCLSVYLIPYLEKKVNEVLYTLPMILNFSTNDILKIFKINSYSFNDQFIDSNNNYYDLYPCLKMYLKNNKDKKDLINFLMIKTKAESRLLSVNIPIQLIEIINKNELNVVTEHNTKIETMHDLVSTLYQKKQIFFLNNCPVELTKVCIVSPGNEFNYAEIINKSKTQLANHPNTMTPVENTTKSLPFQTYNGKSINLALGNYLILDQEKKWPYFANNALTDERGLLKRGEWVRIESFFLPAHSSSKDSIIFKGTVSSHEKDVFLLLDNNIKFTRQPFSPSKKRLPHKIKNTISHQIQNNNNIKSAKIIKNPQIDLAIQLEKDAMISMNEIKKRVNDNQRFKPINALFSIKGFEIEKGLSKYNKTIYEIKIEIDSTKKNLIQNDVDILKVFLQLILPEFSKIEEINEIWFYILYNNKKICNVEPWKRTNRMNYKMNVD